MYIAQSKYPTYIVYYQIYKDVFDIMGKQALTWSYLDVLNMFFNQ